MGEAPAAFALLPAQPNPFNPSTAIRFRLAQTAPVTLAIYDLGGRRLRTLLEGPLQAAGEQSVTWDGRDGAGLPLPSGVYFVRLACAGRSAAQKVVLLK